MFEYINKPDRIIILYDEDEGIAHKAATTIVQRGINNVFMLSGGAYALWPPSVLACSWGEGGGGFHIPACLAFKRLGSSVDRSTCPLILIYAARLDVRGLCRSQGVC